MKERPQLLRRTLLFASLYLFPVTMYFLSPVLPWEGLFAHEGPGGILVGSLLVFAALFVSSLVFGRFFCGWICPGGGMQEMCSNFVSDRPVKPGWRDLLKYVIWVPWLGGLIAGFAVTGGITSVDFLFHTHFSLPFEEWGQLIIIHLAVSLVILVSALAVGRRGFCHAVCWMAPFMVLGRKLANLLHLPGLRLTAAKEACISCGLCTRACAMSLDVKAMVASGRMEQAECILCRRCVHACPKDVLDTRFRRP